MQECHDLHAEDTIDTATVRLGDTNRAGHAAMGLLKQTVWRELRDVVQRNRNVAKLVWAWGACTGLHWPGRRCMLCRCNQGTQARRLQPTQPTSRSLWRVSCVSEDTAVCVESIPAACELAHVLRFCRELVGAACTYQGCVGTRAGAASGVPPYSDCSDLSQSEGDRLKS